MARHAHPGERLRAEREAREMQLDDVAYEVRHAAPREKCSSETIRRYKVGIVEPKNWRPTIAAKLIRMFELDQYAFGPEVGDALDALRATLPAGNVGTDRTPRDSDATWRYARKAA